jgi:serine/threonine-protein kinase RsbW
MESISESVTFDATLDSLSPIREYLVQVGKSVGLDKSRIYKLCLAVDEIATNIINYGYAPSEISKGKIDLAVYSENDQMNVILEDSAIPFNPLEHIIPAVEDLTKPFEERPIGGLGIMLARENVDEFKYTYQNGKNRNIFCINLNKY